MRHKKQKNQLNRFTSWRKSTINSLVRSLLMHQSIKTTLHRARAARPIAEKLINLAKHNTLTAKRQAAKILNDHKLVSMLFGDIGPRFSKRQSGFTRILNLGVRRGDDASMVIFELTEIKEKKINKPKKGKELLPEETVAEEPKEEIKEPKKTATAVLEKEKPPISKKPSKKFLGGIRSIFKKERDSL
jgi:large subunit ribosomal protein L17